MLWSRSLSSPQFIQVFPPNIDDSPLKMETPLQVGNPGLYPTVALKAKLAKLTADSSLGIIKAKSRAKASVFRRYCFGKTDAS